MGHKSLCKARKLPLGSMFPLCPILPQHSASCCTHSTAFSGTGMSFLQDTAISCFKMCSSQHLLLYVTHWCVPEDERYTKPYFEVVKFWSFWFSTWNKDEPVDNIRAFPSILGICGNLWDLLQAHSYRLLLRWSYDYLQRFLGPLTDPNILLSLYSLLVQVLKSCAKNSSLWCRTSTRGGVQVSPVDKS